MKLICNEIPSFACISFVESSFITFFQILLDDTKGEKRKFRISPKIIKGR